jgi:rhodanese-related sulfurtransferase
MSENTEDLIPELSAQETSELMARGEDIVLLDVREAHEFQWAHLTDPRVRYVPLSHLAQRGLAALPEGLREPGGLHLLGCIPRVARTTSTSTRCSALKKVHRTRSIYRSVVMIP